MPSTAPSPDRRRAGRLGPAVVSAGLGAREALEARGEGDVLASFPQAVYLRLPQAIVVLTAPGVPPGPVYLRLERRLPRLRAGTGAVLAPDLVVVGGWSLPVRARTWRGAIPAPPQVRRAAGDISAAARRVAAGSLLDPSARSLAASALRAPDLEAAAAALGGRGPGLTPSGDDAMAGILFAARLLWGPSVEDELVEVAGGLATGPIALAFASWAARGQALAPAHRMVLAASHNDAAGARRSAEALGRVGESSGADFCLGLSMAMDLLPSSA